MITIQDKKTCCGCSACIEICPKNCISFNKDIEGFNYPLVDPDECINCGLCVNICPMKKERTVSYQCEVQAYVGYALNSDVRLKSSSGGIFTLLATDILNKGGVVFGAAFDSSFMVQHICITNLDDLYKLQGSKYAQSELNDCFKKVKYYLEQNIYVLFSGTECQIEGLKNYLQKEYEKLLSIDVLCHGVPTPKLWRKYLDEKCSKSGNIKYINFRSKDIGWRNYQMKIEFVNREKYTAKNNFDPYMRLFLSDICLRPSCYDCQFKHIDRISDITIGDCWDISDYMPEMDDDNGVSVIITHTKKGEHFLSAIKEQLILKNAELDKALPPNADSRKSVTPHKFRSKFFIMLNKSASVDDMEKLLKLSFFDKVRNKTKYYISSIIKNDEIHQ